MHWNQASFHFLLERKRTYFFLQEIGGQAKRKIVYLYYYLYIYTIFYSIVIYKGGEEGQKKSRKTYSPGPTLGVLTTHTCVGHFGVVFVLSAILGFFSRFICEFGPFLNKMAKIQLLANIFP